MTKKNQDQELIAMSEFFEKVSDLENRYKSLKKTIKNIKRFNETQIKGPIAEA